jgi:hypothetical protein
MRVASFTGSCAVMIIAIAACGGIAADQVDPFADAGTGNAAAGGKRGTSSTSTEEGTDEGNGRGAMGLPDAGAFVPMHDRCSTNADCPGGTCERLSPGGVRVCASPPPAPQPCVDAGQQLPFSDACCPNDNRCGASRCVLATFCGGPFVNPHNECATDECTQNSDCGPRGICLPIGVGDPSRRTCLTGNACLTNADCNAAPSGACVMPGTIGPKDQCEGWACFGSNGGTANPLVCVYGGSCADDRECGADRHCDGSILGGSFCAQGSRTVCPPPP